jgi:hypothetical protein
VSTVDPAVGSAQIMRRVSSTLKLTKATYQSNEIRLIGRFTTSVTAYKKAEGGISGEYSPGTYFPFRKPHVAGRNRPPSRRRRQR